MALDKNLIFKFNHSDQADELFGNLTAQEIKEAFDSRGEDLKNYLYGLVDKINNEGGSHIPVEFHGSKTPIQTAITTICQEKVPFESVGDIGDIIFENTNGYEYEIISRT